MVPMSMMAMTVMMPVFTMTVFVMNVAIFGCVAMIVVMVMPRRAGYFVASRTVVAALHLAGGLVHASHSTRNNSSAQPCDCLLLLFLVRFGKGLAHGSRPL